MPSATAEPRIQIGMTLTTRADGCPATPFGAEALATEPALPASDLAPEALDHRKSGSPARGLKRAEVEVWRLLSHEFRAYRRGGAIGR
jgi:hypothetical protein